MKFDINIARDFVANSLARISADTLGWLAAILLHAATVPTMLALITGLSDRPPSLDLVLFMWSALVLLFLRAIVLKDNLNIITIGLGFIVQAVMMALVLCNLKEKVLKSDSLDANKTVHVATHKTQGEQAKFFHCQLNILFLLNGGCKFK